jgi:heterodisulfide reductase subunit A-like polyferredoxin
MVLNKEAKCLKELFSLSLTEDGFLASPPTRTGVFVTGACKGPKDIDRSILDAKSAALLVQQHLRGRS